MPKSASFLLAMALCVSGCFDAASPLPLPSPSPVGPSPASVYAGRFRGRTSQGLLFLFDVSPAQQVTAVGVAYSLGGCNDSVTYTGWSVSIDLPGSGDPSGNGGSGNPRFTFSNSGPNNTNRIDVTGEFTSSETAIGTVTFSQYFGCGDGAVTWAAVKLPASGS